MDLIEGSETSAKINQMLGIHPKIETVNTEHSESLKSRKSIIYLFGRCRFNRTINQNANKRKNVDL
jgi:hypothetical protein